MVNFTSNEDLNGITIPGPAFELPGWAHNKNGNDSIPIARS